MSERAQQALVLGLGVSGEAAARLLAAEGWRVTAVDASAAPKVEARAAALRAAGVSAVAGVQDLPDDGWALAVASPGFDIDSPWLARLRAQGVPVLPEFELGWSRFRGRTIAVTGSNGKSSVVTWLAAALARAGQRAVASGNIGLPVCAAVAARPAPEWLVIEVSSFQLEAAVRFRPDVGVLLNLVPNHLDRHGTFERYVAAKARLFDGDAGARCAVLPAKWRDRLPGGGPAACLTFGAGGDADFSYSDGLVRRGAEVCADLRGTYFGNPVLGVNASAGLAALAAAGLGGTCAEQAARSFRPLPHRMQEIARRQGVRFIDDSKATTLGALAAAVAMCDGRVRLLAGGRLKEIDLSAPKKMLVERAAGVYLFGECAERLAEAWAPEVPCMICRTLAEAVPRAADAAREGESVLLSPGCASFDQFAGYAERGDEFRRQVEEWMRNRES